MTGLNVKWRMNVNFLTKHDITTLIKESTLNIHNKINTRRMQCDALRRCYRYRVTRHASKRRGRRNQPINGFRPCRSDATTAAALFGSDWLSAGSCGSCGILIGCRSRSSGSWGSVFGIWLDELATGSGDGGGSIASLLFFFRFRFFFLSPVTSLIGSCCCCCCCCCVAPPCGGGAGLSMAPPESTLLYNLESYSQSACSFVNSRSKYMNLNRSATQELEIF